MLAFRVCSIERNADACAWCNFNSCSEFPRPPFLVSKQIEEMKHVPYNVYSGCSFTGLALAVDLKVLCLVVPLFSPFTRLSFLALVSFLSVLFDMFFAAWRESYRKTRLVRKAEVERERSA